MSLLDGLNPAQKEAVLYTEGPLLILAGAGSGKTRVLTHRMAYLIEKGVSPFNILAITFTNKAAKEMKERVAGLVGEGSGIWVSTFHSTCVRILRQTIERLDFSSNFVIYDSDDSKRLLKNCIKDLNLNEKYYPVSKLSTYISSYKDKLISPYEAKRQGEGDYNETTIASIYSLYQKRLASYNALDFDDIIYKTVELFNLNPDILERYQNRFEYIMIDEYQDTNYAQYVLVKLLASKYRNLCVVGDDDQSIYSWRGADVQNILGFEKDFPETKTIKLEQNYRSTSTILDTANSVISHNLRRKPKTLWTENSEGVAIKVFKAESDLSEGTFVAEKIAERVEAGDSYGDFAILYRTNAQSRILEDSLFKKNIPHRILGGVRFYDRKEIKDILAYLRIIYNPKDDIAVKRIINIPKRGIGNATIDKVSSYAEEHEISFYEALGEAANIPSIKTKAKPLTKFFDLIEQFANQSRFLNISDLLGVIVKEIDYSIELELDDEIVAESRMENIEELINKAVEFEKYSEDKSLAAFLEEVTLVADVDNYDSNADAVVLMTMHSAKGLEFDNVFIVGLEEMIFPSYRSVTASESDALEEERRLCYVAITRARKNLYLCSAKQRLHNGKYTYNSPSRFIGEINDELLEHINKAKPKPKRAVKETIPEKEFRNNYAPFPKPKDVTLDFEIGDMVSQRKYGKGKVIDIKPAGKDYEISIDFGDEKIKKFMAALSNIKKCD